MVDLCFFVLLYDLMFSLFPPELYLQIKEFILLHSDDLLVVPFFFQHLSQFLLRVQQIALEILDFVFESAYC